MKSGKSFSNKNKLLFSCLKTWRVATSYIFFKSRDCYFLFAGIYIVLNVVSDCISYFCILLYECYPNY